MKIITGYLRADKGSVYIDGELVSMDEPNLRKKIGYLPEHNPLYTDLYVKEFLEITAGFYKLKNKKTRISEIIEITGLIDESKKKIKALSKGYRQRVGLAQALIHDPEVLILDEPTTGLDPNQLEEIRNLIKNISEKKTVILSSHIMQEIEAICKRALIIHKGKIVADNEISRLKSGKLNQQQQVLVKFNQQIQKDELLSLKCISNVEEDKGFWILTAKTKDDIRPDIFSFAVKKNLIILTIQEKQQSLENIFQQLTR